VEVTERRPALVFYGFMGAGKSTAAAAAAAALEVEVIDLDALLELEFGRPIPEVFEAQGEAAFRAREEALACELLDRADGGVIALGGGTVLSERVQRALERHIAVLLEIDADTAWARVGGGGRPLARDKPSFLARYAARKPVYEGLADAYVRGESSAVLRALDALQALRESPPGTRMAWAHATSGDYPVFVGRGILGTLPWPLPGRRFCVSDETVAQLYAAKVGDLAGLIEIRPGESHKTLAEADAVWRALARQGAARSDHLVALGGGVVGDLAGFCAATYQRGIPFVQVPTTVVAQVDSAYGGKTGVDLPEAKNYVGAYHQPAAVIADTATLATLPPEEHAAGYAEVVKTALIAGGELWERVARGDPVDDDVILACARTKLAVVSADERDAGRRQVLNLGHTIGHAIETVTGYARVRHGEAVALGLLAALRLSGAEDLRAQVRALLEAAGLPVALEGVDAREVVAATARDKKRTGAGVPFVLAAAPGEVTHGHELREADVLAAVQELTGPQP
jgi:shikimate kinase/3-dehydroquinate synthase